MGAPGVWEDQPEIKAMTEALQISIQVNTYFYTYLHICKFIQSTYIQSFIIYKEDCPLTYNDGASSVIMLHYRNQHHDLIVREELPRPRSWVAVPVLSRKQRATYLAKVDSIMGQAVQLHYVSRPINPKTTFYSFPDFQDEDSVPILDVFKMPAPVDSEIGCRYGFEWQTTDLQKALDVLNIRPKF